MNGHRLDQNSPPGSRRSPGHRCLLPVSGTYRLAAVSPPPTATRPSDHPRRRAMAGQPPRRHRRRIRRRPSHPPAESPAGVTVASPLSGGTGTCPAHEPIPHGYAPRHDDEPREPHRRGCPWTRTPDSRRARRHSGRDRPPAGWRAGQQHRDRVGRLWRSGRRLGRQRWRIQHAGPSGRHPVTIAQERERRGPTVGPSSTGPRAGWPGEFRTDRPADALTRRDVHGTVSHVAAGRRRSHAAVHRPHHNQIIARRTS